MMTRALIITALMLLTACDPQAIGYVTPANKYSTLVMNPICVVLCTPTVSAARSEVAQGATSNTTQSTTASPTTN